MSRCIYIDKWVLFCRFTEKLVAWKWVQLHSKRCKKVKINGFVVTIWYLVLYHLVNVSCKGISNGSTKMFSDNSILLFWWTVPVVHLGTYTINKKFVGLMFPWLKLQIFQTGKIHPSTKIFILFKLQIYLPTNLLKPLKTFYMGYFSYLVLTYKSISMQQTAVCVHVLLSVLYMVGQKPIKRTLWGIFKNVKHFIGKIFSFDKCYLAKKFKS